MRYRYEINIPIMFIAGVVFFIWGLVITVDGLENRKNLRHIYDEDVNVTELKEGNYVAADVVNLFGREIDGVFSHLQCVYLYPAEYNYYVVNINPSTNQYIGLRVEPKYKRFEDYIGETGICDFSGNAKTDGDIKFMAKAVKSDSVHRYTIGDAKSEKNAVLCEFNEKIALELVDFEEERELLISGIYVFMAGLIFLLGSKPWKMVKKREVAPERAFNLVYKEEIDEKDMRFLEETARCLRMDIKYYEDDYKMFKKNVIKNLIAFAVSFLIFVKIKIFIALLILAVLYFIKFAASVIKLVLNRDNAFAASMLSAVHKEPVMRILNDKKRKLEKCDRIIRESLRKKTDYD